MEVRINLSSQFDDAFARHAPDLVPVAFLLTGSARESVDAVGSVIRLHCEAEGQAERSSFALLTETVRRARICYRKRCRDRLNSQIELGLGSELSPDSMRILGALSVLGDRRRTAVVLHWFLGLPTVEVASIMLSTPDTIDSLLVDGLGDLVGELGPRRPEALADRLPSELESASTGATWPAAYRPLIEIDDRGRERRIEMLRSSALALFVALMFVVLMVGLPENQSNELPFPHIHIGDFINTGKTMAITGTA